MLVAMTVASRVNKIIFPLASMDLNGLFIVPVFLITILHLDPLMVHMVIQKRITKGNNFDKINMVNYVMM